MEESWWSLLLVGGYLQQQGARFPPAFFPIWILGPLRQEGRRPRPIPKNASPPAIFSPARAVQQRAPGWFVELLPPIFLCGVVVFLVKGTP